MPCSHVMSIVILPVKSFDISIPIVIGCEFNNCYLTQLLLQLLLEDNEILVLSKQKSNGLQMSRLGPSVLRK